MINHWKTHLNLGWIASCLMIISCATTTDFVTGKSTYNSFSIEEDIELGKIIRDRNIQVFEQEDIPINEDKKMVANLENIVKVLAAVSDLPNLPYNVNLIQAADIINAAAAPGGSILVYEGLYVPKNDFVKTNDELAAVLAHEIGHVTARHTTEELSRKKAVATAGKFVSTALSLAVGFTTGDSNLSDLAGNLFDTAYGIGTAVWFPVYTRSQEAEADAIGMKYLAKAGINPQAAIDIWKRASTKSKDKPYSLFASHPSDEQRYNALEALLPENMAIYNQVVAAKSGK